MVTVDGCRRRSHRRPTCRSARHAVARPFLVTIRSRRCSTSTRAPAACARGRYVSVMLWRLPSTALPRSGYVIHRGISSWRQPIRSAPSRSFSLAAVWAPGTVCTLRAVSTSSQIVSMSSVAKSSIEVVTTPTIERLRRGSAVEAAVDLGAAAGATALGVGDRREPERDGHTTGAVLAIHLFQRERHDRTLGHPRAFLDDDHVEARLGEDRGRGGTAGTRADDQDVAVVAAPLVMWLRWALMRRAGRSGVGPGLPDEGVAERADEPRVLGEERERLGRDEGGGPVEADHTAHQIDGERDHDDAEPGERRQRRRPAAR